uniref:PHD-type domain-containing protein n=1 Tax=Periophthalmus magnuspinnatus TaxID=409849 RepID=A0A3B4B9D1_9GOBI
MLSDRIIVLRTKTQIITTWPSSLFFVLKNKSALRLLLVKAIFDMNMFTMYPGTRIGQKLNTPAVLKAPKERKPNKKEGGSPGKSSSLPAILYSCGICKKNQDQHLLVLCDTCKLYYHLGCLEPPLTRMPKKTKNSYWQCSECDQASSDEADIAMATLPDGTKRSRRQIKGPIKFIPQEMSPEPKKSQVRSSRTRGQKRKRLNLSEEPEEKVEEPAPRERRQRQSALQKKPKADDTRTECTTCKGPGDNENLVRCDQCSLCYHFGCLDPPLKKSPKQTGYGWICQECDTSSSKVSRDVTVLQFSVMTIVRRDMILLLFTIIMRRGVSV